MRAAKKNTTKKSFSKKPAKKALPSSKPDYKKKSSKPRSNKKSNTGCYFTTACCEYFMLPDNCYQLQTLRKFRDDVMCKTNQGQKLITLYYRIAPLIVEQIKKSKNQSREFKKIFNHINKSCLLIESKNHYDAINEYKFMVEYLMKKYL